MKNSIKEILRLGKKQGFITYDMLNDSIGNRSISEEDIEDVFRLLESAGIPVVDSPGELKNMKTGKKATVPSVDRDEGVPFDPVEVYLAEMNRFPRIERDEERRIIDTMRELKYALIDRLSKKEELREYLEELSRTDSSHHATLPDGSEDSAASVVEDTPSGIRCREAERLASRVTGDDLDSQDVLPVFTPFTEQELSKIQESVHEIADLRRMLIEGHVRLVVSMAIKHQNRGVDFLDLVQEGNTGLISAAEHFDPEREEPFGAYATWWIREAMKRAIREQSNVYHLSRALSERLKKLNRVRRDLAQQLEREPTPREIAEELNTDEETVIRLMRVTRKSLRLDQPADTEEDASLGDVIDLQKHREDRSLDKRTVQNLLRIIESLDEREANVIRLRFGIGDGIVHSVEQTARVLRLSEDRIRELEKRALMNLRHPSKRTELDSPE